jgi:hypothetical protein
MFQKFNSQITKFEFVIYQAQVMISQPSNHKDNITPSQSIVILFNIFFLCQNLQNYKINCRTNNF